MRVKYKPHMSDFLSTDLPSLPPGAAQRVVEAILIKHAGDHVLAIYPYGAHWIAGAICDALGVDRRQVNRPHFPCPCRPSPDGRSVDVNADCDVHTLVEDQTEPVKPVQPEVWIWEFDDEDYYSSGALLVANIYYPTFQAACQAAEAHCAKRFHHDVTPMVWTEQKHCPSVFMAKRPQTDPDITWVGDGCYFVSKMVMAE